MKTKLFEVTKSNGEKIYINPAYITSITPTRDEQTRIDHFGWSSFVGSNLICCLTHENIESVVRRLEEAQ
jgi:hypothetical protein